MLILVRLFELFIEYFAHGLNLGGDKIFQLNLLVKLYIFPYYAVSEQILSYSPSKTNLRIFYEGELITKFGFRKSIPY